MPKFRFFLAAFTASGLILFSGCGTPIDSKPQSATDTYKIPLQFTVGTSFGLSESKQVLYQRIQNKESVSFKAITETLIEDHYRNWIDRRRDLNNPSFAQALKRIQSFATPFESAELGDIKETLEARVEGVSGQRPVYNSRAVSLLDIPYSRRMQAFSGTSLLLVALREAWGRTRLEQSHSVAIYESGHILPGYLVQKEGKWHLVGIETAVTNKGRVLYGPLEDALKARLLRIVDAELWAVVELFKFEADNLVDLANQALKLTAEKYSIADPAYLVESRFRREADYSKLAWSPFSFGNPDIGVGDRSRASFEEAPRSELPRANPNTTVLHKSAPVQKIPDSKSEETFDAFGEPTYPYREVADSEGIDGKKFQCWHFQRREWVDLVHEKEEATGFYIIRYNPCEMSKENYEPVPLPLKLIKTSYERPPYDYGGYYDSDSDVDDDDGP